MTQQEAIQQIQNEQFVFNVELCQGCFYHSTEKSCCHKEEEYNKQFDKIKSLCNKLQGELKDKIILTSINCHSQANQNIDQTPQSIQELNLSKEQQSDNQLIYINENSYQDQTLDKDNINKFSDKQLNNLTNQIQNNDCVDQQNLKNSLPKISQQKGPQIIIQDLNETLKNISQTNLDQQKDNPFSIINIINTNIQTQQDQNQQNESQQLLQNSYNNLKNQLDNKDEDQNIQISQIQNQNKLSNQNSLHYLGQNSLEQNKLIKNQNIEKANTTSISGFKGQNQSKNGSFSNLLSSTVIGQQQGKPRKSILAILKMGKVNFNNVNNQNQQIQKRNIKEFNYFKGKFEKTSPSKQKINSLLKNLIQSSYDSISYMPQKKSESIEKVDFTQFTLEIEKGNQNCSSETQRDSNDVQFLPFTLNVTSLFNEGEERLIDIEVHNSQQIGDTLIGLNRLYFKDLFKQQDIVLFDQKSKMQKGIFSIKNLQHIPEKQDLELVNDPLKDFILKYPTQFSLCIKLQSEQNYEHINLFHEEAEELCEEVYSEGGEVFFYREAEDLEFLFGDFLYSFVNCFIVSI
ncbi:hypothetical protein PPERSA_02868 [Pseudocohnilembus persalinus]|uniref:Uncharacterized protein n=1 Tax=Pseudocohnilembus persalinus TaxID=266149 RepID=A0A0V0QN34_PSEPJ|nr:hypothetical protein PPERSA_02868 [Pseudocohnilembus persalinus]|eukprot:KRX03489.1 hypothetical protein PPERSA_02868 [Pseudocohnilembus persalinus]